MLENGHKVRLGSEIDIIWEPDERLHKQSSKVIVVDDQIRNEIDSMVATMIAAHGVGLAAIQVGIPKRMLVVECSYLIKKYPGSEKGLPNDTTILRMINPEVINAYGSCVEEEGCLSVPGLNPEVERAKRIKVKYLDYWGNKQEIELNGFVARCFLHELDHLNGITLLDKVSPLKKSLALKKIQKMKKRAS